MHISKRLAEHETSVEHITNMNTWNELRAEIDKDEIIDRDTTTNKEGKRTHKASFI
jgi:hypothetical protein